MRIFNSALDDLILAEVKFFIIGNDEMGALKVAIKFSTAGVLFSTFLIFSNSWFCVLDVSASTFLATKESVMGARILFKVCSLTAGNIRHFDFNLLANQPVHTDRDVLNVMTSILTNLRHQRHRLYFFAPKAKRVEAIFSVLSYCAALRQGRLRSRR